jgi:hypothetical protein
MFAIEEIITDTAGQDARKVCAELVNGAPLFEKEGQGGFVDVCSKQVS